MNPTTGKPYGTLQVAFRAGEMQSEIEARTDRGSSPSLTAQRDLARYYYHLRLALPTFTVAEASLIVDAMNGTLTDPHTASLLWANVADSLDDGLAEKWSVDGAALVARLRALTPFEQLAIADACERFWCGQAYRQEGAIEERLRAVGLVW